jgi:Fic family protein
LILLRRKPDASSALYRDFTPLCLQRFHLRSAYDVDLVNVLSRADAALSELSDLGHTLPNPQLLIARYVRLEAVVSSRIEGTQASLHDLSTEELDSEPALPRRHQDVLEVRKYARAGVWN